MWSCKSRRHFLWVEPWSTTLRGWWLRLQDWTSCQATYLGGPKMGDFDLLIQHSYGAWENAIYCVQCPQLFPVHHAWESLVAGNPHPLNFVAKRWITAMKQLTGSWAKSCLTITWVVCTLSLLKCVIILIFAKQVLKQTSMNSFLVSGPWHDPVVIEDVNSSLGFFFTLLLGATVLRWQRMGL